MWGFLGQKKISNKTLDTLIKIWRSLKSQFCWFNGSNKRVERGTYIFYGHGDDIWRHSQNNKCHYFLEESHYSREGVAVKRSPQILMNEKWSRKVIFLITWYKIDKNIILKGIFVLGNRYLDAPLGVEKTGRYHSFQRGKFTYKSYFEFDLIKHQNFAPQVTFLKAAIFSSMMTDDWCYSFSVIYCKQQKVLLFEFIRIVSSNSKNSK